MKLTKFLLLALLISTSASYANAQRGGRSNVPPEERAKQQTETMTTELGLSAKQAEKIGEVNLKYALKMKEVRENNQDGDWSAMRETMMKFRKEQNAELQKMMTNEQFQKWEQYLSEQRKQRREQRGNRNRSGDAPKKENQG